MVIVSVADILDRFTCRRDRRPSSSSSSTAMHGELSVALNFIISHLYNKLPRRRVDVFREELQRGFELRFAGHWYPDEPTKGSGFRCVKLAADKVRTPPTELNILSRVNTSN